MTGRRPENCANMAELRRVIDGLDAELIELLARRAACIDRAIQLKPKEGVPARVAERVEEVVANVRRRAAAEGLDEALVERLWRDLIEWSIARESRALGGE